MIMMCTHTRHGYALNKGLHKTLADVKSVPPLSNNLNTQHIFCRLYSRCTISEAHLANQRKLEPTVSACFEFCSVSSLSWKCLDMLRETWGNVTFIPDRPFLYSEDLDRGHVFISQCAARTQDMWEKGGYKVERYLLSSDVADIT